MTEAAARLTLAVPAAFEVSVGMSGGACDVDVAGWLEGCVHVSTDSGSVDVKTVRGMLTRLHTGAGDVSVGSVDGNLDAETGDGSVTLGKTVGEEVRAIAGGRASNELREGHIYAKRTELSSSGTMQARRPPPSALRTPHTAHCALHTALRIHDTALCMVCMHGTMQVSVLAHPVRR